MSSKTEENSKTKDSKSHKRTALYTENLPTFYVGVGNNAEL